MNDTRDSIIGKVDWVLVLLWVALVVLGWLNIYSAVYDDTHPSLFDVSKVYGKQLIWIAVAAFLGFMVLLPDTKVYNAVSFTLYVVFILLLFGVLIYVKASTKGANSWIELGGGVKLQPSEFAKMATALFLSSYLGRLETDLTKTKSIIVSFMIVMLPAVLVLLQNDTGSALVFLSFIFVFYREGMPYAGFLMLAAVVAVALFVFTLLWSQKVMYIVLGIMFAVMLILFIVTNHKRQIITLSLIFAMMFGFVFISSFAFNSILQPHQQQRIEVLLGMREDLKGAGYNVHQSKIAIGSGGLTGKGFLNGTQTKYDFVPEQHTDFIFCTVGEEHGFLGTLVLILLYLALMLRILFRAEIQRSALSRIYGYSIAGILFVHFAINIGMTIGVVPVIGIPLPFLSYGGSSMIAFTIMLAIFVKFDASRLKNL